MAKNRDQVEGRVKEAVGSLTDDPDLEREGKTDRIAGDAKETVGKAKNKVEGMIDRARDAVRKK